MNTEASLQASVTKQRNIGLDAIKLAASLNTIILYVLWMTMPADSALGIAHHPFLFYLARSALPCFFMANGYIMFAKKEVYYKYSFKKVFHILLAVLLWIAIANILFYFFCPSRFSITNLFWWVLQRGGSGQFWFCFTMSILYMLLPMLNNMASLLPSWRHCSYHKQKQQNSQSGKVGCDTADYSFDAVSILGVQYCLQYYKQRVLR